MQWCELPVVIEASYFLEMNHAEMDSSAGVNGCMGRGRSPDGQGSIPLTLRNSLRLFPGKLFIRAGGVEDRYFLNRVWQVRVLLRAQARIAQWQSSGCFPSVFARSPALHLSSGA